MTRPLPLPQSKKAEESVLAVALFEPDVHLKLKWLQPEDFIDPLRGNIFAELRDIYERDMTYDPMVITELLGSKGLLSELGGPAYISTLVNSGASMTVAHGVQMGRIVAETAKRRALIVKAQTLHIKASDRKIEMDEVVAAAQGLNMLIGESDGDQNTTFSAEELAEEFESHIEFKSKHPGMTGIPTTLTELDKILDGYQKSCFHIVCGRPGHGKTALTMQQAVRQAELGYHVFYFSLEMGLLELMQRMSSFKTGIDLMRIRRLTLTDTEKAQLDNALADLKKLPLWIDFEPSATPGYIESKVTPIAMEEGLDLIYIDQLGLMGYDRAPASNVKGWRFYQLREGNRSEQLGNIAKSLKNLGKKLDCAVVAISQLNRAVESRNDKHPVLPDLRDSGELEQIADIVTSVCRLDLYEDDCPTPNVIDIDILKNRNGPTGRIFSFFNDQSGSFSDVELVEELPLEGF